MKKKFVIVELLGGIMQVVICVFLSTEIWKAARIEPSIVQSEQFDNLVWKILKTTFFGQRWHNQKETRVEQI